MTLSKKDLAKQFIKAVMAFQEEHVYKEPCKMDFAKFIEKNEVESLHQPRITKQLLVDGYIAFMRKTLRQDLSPGCMARAEKKWKEMSHEAQIRYAFMDHQFMDHRLPKTKEKMPSKKDKKKQTRTKRRSSGPGEPVVIKKEPMFSEEEEDDLCENKSDCGYTLQKNDTSDEDE